MGLFQKYKNTDGEVNSDKVEEFLDENFREELRNHGRWYFERVINENGSLFKKDLDSTIEKINFQLNEHVKKQLDVAITQLNVDIKEHVTKQLQKQFDDFTKNMKVAEDATLQLITHSAQDLQKRFTELSKKIDTKISEQDKALDSALKDNQDHLAKANESSSAALKSIQASAGALEEQYKYLRESFEDDIKNQKAEILKSFEHDMAIIMEKYLLEAFAEEVDLKTQVPSIIKHLENDKSAILEDMSL